MNQGDVLAFENDDPFLSHGVAGAGFSAPVIPPLSTSLVRRAAYLGPGNYSIADPKSPGMVSTLTVNSTGAPRPPDASPPASPIRIASSGGSVAKKGRIKVRAAPNEISDVFLTARIGKLVLGTGSRAFLAPARGAVTIRLTPKAAARLPASYRLEVRGAVTDAAGNARKLRTSKRLSSRRR